jgi:uncharacterized protein DUF4145
MADLDVTTIEGLLNAVAAYVQRRQREQPLLEGSGRGSSGVASVGIEPGDALGEFTGTYCGRCSGSRRMRLVAEDTRCSNLTPSKIASTKKTLEALEQDRDPLQFALSGPPAVFSAICLQCQTRLSLVIDAGPPVEVVVLGARSPGLATAHTPQAIAFYLDQAYRSRTRAAHTAATVMYRAALEHLLDDQGFTGKTLQLRIQAAVAAQPSWLGHLDDQLMGAIRRLGNRAVHVNGGDFSKQLSLDRELVREIEQVFLEVLDEIYEAPARRAARRQRFVDADST